MNLDFPYGKRFFIGQLTVVRFQVQGYTYVCLPSFQHYFFISKHLSPSLPQLASEVIAHLQEWPRRQKKEDKTAILLDEYAAEKKEFCTQIDISLYVRQKQVRLGADHDDLFRQFFQQRTEFDGAYEVQKVGSDLNDKYPTELQHAYFRDEIVEQLDKLIYSTERMPLVILGPRRVGKTSILHQVVRRYLDAGQEKDYHQLDNIWQIDPSRVIAGMSIVGMWQRRMEAIISYVMQPHHNYKKRRDKLYFDNLIALFRIGKSAQNNMTLSDVLKPYLQDRQVQVIIEATPGQWDIANEMDRAFTDLFKVIRVQESDFETSMRIIARKRMEMEKRHDFVLQNNPLKNACATEPAVFQAGCACGKGLRQSAPARQ